MELVARLIAKYHASKDVEIEGTREGVQGEKMEVNDDNRRRKATLDSLVRSGF